jgi:hypothetical protein
VGLVGQRLGQAGHEEEPGGRQPAQEHERVVQPLVAHPPALDDPGRQDVDLDHEQHGQAALPVEPVFSRGSGHRGTSSLCAGLSRAGRGSLVAVGDAPASGRAALPGMMRMWNFFILPEA